MSFLIINELYKILPSLKNNRRRLVNLEAARAGKAPQLADGFFVTLHHFSQRSSGPVIEASTRYHGVGKSGQQTLHSMYGTSKAHPEKPVDHEIWKKETRQYWKDTEIESREK